MNDEDDFVCSGTTGVRVWENKAGGITLQADIQDDFPGGDPPIITISYSDAARLAQYLQSISTES